MKQCDGEQELPESELAKELMRRGMITPCEKGTARLDPWQKPMDCENRYAPHIMISLTGRCNLNCLHCFNAADNAKLQSELSIETLDRLLDEAQACGVHAVALTGGCGVTENFPPLEDKRCPYCGMKKLEYAETIIDLNDGSIISCKSYNKSFSQPQAIYYKLFRTAVRTDACPKPYPALTLRAE